MKKTEKDLFLTLQGTGRQDCTDLHSWGPGVRQFFIIHYIIRGSGFFTCNGKKYHIFKGQSFFISPDTPVEYHPDPGDPWEYTWADFSGVEARRLLENTDFSADNPVAPVFSDCPLALFESLTVQVSESIAEKACLQSAALHLLLAFYIRNFPARKPERYANEIVEQALRYIDGNMHRAELNIESIADALGLNRVSLYRHFKSQLGISPNNYITDVRIDRAKKLLSDTNMPIKAVAFSVGYGDPLYFSKSFRKSTGKSPTEFRKSLLNS